ncbi:hypothetical protein [Sphaerisporangium sp. TRM90804]|uniref:hypothetical protein n=1 Tax=Sphaerisporangium sp. TRM90804 TaxID=3031113 RepID=UPI002449D3C9|nr:hypothetical protein [Sphaerisporangium sp. TRM90804]MDH2429590.1 hypothetical protein [Sphaerisporangium sp. TRM90804]
MNRRSLLAVLGWLAVAALTTLTSTWAISLLGEGLSERVVTPVSQADLARTLASASAVPRPAVPSRPSAAPGKAFNTQGGSLVASCDAGRAVLGSWSPAQGYAADDVKPGPDAAASLEFEADAETVKVTVTCRGDVPVTAVKVEREND